MEKVGREEGRGETPFAVTTFEDMALPITNGAAQCGAEC